MDQYADSGQPIDYTPYQKAIKDIESGGGNYGAIGPQTANGDQAYGAYQVMGSNVPDWTEKHYGTRLTPQQFLQNKDAQDAVFNGEFGSYLDKHGPQDAAAMWFSGRPLSQSANNSDGYITTKQYVDKFNKGLGKYSGGALGFANTDDDDDEDTPASSGTAKPALSTNNVMGKGALQTIMKSGDDDKLSTIGSTMAGIGSALAGISSPSQGNALQTLAQNIAKGGKTDYKYMMGADGTLYRMDDSGGIQAIKTGSTKQQPMFKPIMGKDARGNPVFLGKFEEHSGAYTPMQASSPQQQGLDENGLPDTFEDLQKLNPSLANQVAGINAGAVKLPTASRLNPLNAQIRNAVFKYFPDTDENTFNSRNQFSKNFGTDQPSQPGGQSVGLGHSLDILDQLGQNYVKQNNYGPMLGIGTTLNSIKNNKSYGGENSATANTGGDLAYKLATETGRLYSGNQGGGVHERDATLQRFGGDAQTLTPVMQAGILREQRNVLTSRQEELEAQRDKIFGSDPAAAKRYSFRTERTQKSLDNINATLAKLDPNGPEARMMAAQNAGQKSAAPADGNRPPLASFF